MATPDNNRRYGNQYTRLHAAELTHEQMRSLLRVGMLSLMEMPEPHDSVYPYAADCLERMFNKVDEWEEYFRIVSGEPTDQQEPAELPADMMGNLLTSTAKDMSRQYTPDAGTDQFTVAVGIRTAETTLAATLDQMRFPE